jgi:hypothetical protein
VLSFSLPFLTEWKGKDCQNAKNKMVYSDELKENRMNFRHKEEKNQLSLKREKLGLDIL